MKNKIKDILKEHELLYHYMKPTEPYDAVWRGIYEVTTIETNFD